MKPQKYSLILLASFVLPVLILAGVIHVERNTIKQEVKEFFITRIADTALEKLSFHYLQTNTAVRWKDAAEFEYKNKMYDVVRTKKIGDSVIYFCFPDHKETKLNQELENLVAYALGNHSQQHSDEQQLIDFFKTLYCTHHSTLTLCEPTYHTLFFTTTSPLAHRGFAPDSPPPWPLA